jgi:hypothetical protein
MGDSQVLNTDSLSCRVPHPSRVLKGGSIRRCWGHQPGSRQNNSCTTLVYTDAMAATKSVRRSVSLPAQVAKQVDGIARRRRLSENRVLVELIEEGIEARKQKEKAFFELAERFRSAEDPEEVKRLGDDMGRFVFGE